MRSSHNQDNYRNGGTSSGNISSAFNTRSGGGLRPRSPSHAAKNKTPEDRVCEFGWMLTEKDGRLVCRACNLNLDHTRRSTIVEHLRSRKHQRFLEESGLDLPNADAASVAPIVLMEIDEENSPNDTQSSSDRPSSQSSPTPGMAGPYLLKKETHCTTILDQLLRDDTFTDVTLTAEGQSVRAHRIVLCLASAYFKQVLSKESNVQNVIFFRDVKFNELKNLINFIYTGEATVDAAELESFMKTAEMLEISSLCDGQRNLPKSFYANKHKAQESERERSKTTTSSSSTKRTSSSCHSPPSKSRKLDSSKLSKHISQPSTSTAQVIKSEPIGDDEISEDDAYREIPKEIYGAQEDRTYEIPEGKRSPVGYRDDVDKSPPPYSSSPELGTSDHPIEKVSPGRCPFCPSTQQLRKGATMNKHLYICHPEKTVFFCDTCSKVFLKRSSFDAHQEDCNR